MQVHFFHAPKSGQRGKIMRCTVHVYSFFKTIIPQGFVVCSSVFIFSSFFSLFDQNMIFFTSKPLVSHRHQFKIRVEKMRRQTNAHTRTTQIQFSASRLCRTERNRKCSTLDFVCLFSSQHSVCVCACASVNLLYLARSVQVVA